MPFRSKAQMRKMAMLERQGKVAKGTMHKWKQHTGSTKDLPEHVIARKLGHKGK